MSAEKYNQRNPAVKRILQELKEIQRDDSPDILAEVLEDNLFEWHFVIRGAWGSEFERGIYHGRILMPADYPFKPPAFVMLTPSGRFETGTKICLSISSYHPESWQPSWSVRSALVALIAFMQTPGNGAVGSLDHSPAVRRDMAAEARATPPKHGSHDRQVLINDMHQRMVDMEERSLSLYRQEASNDGTAAGPAAADPGWKSFPGSATPGRLRAEEDAPVAAAPSDPAAATREAGQADDFQAAPPAAPPSEGSAAALPGARPPASAPDLAPAPERQPSSSRPAPTSPPPRRPPGAAVHSDAGVVHEQRGPRDQVELAAPQPQPQPHLRPQRGGSGAWEDRGLTYIALLLLLLIAALTLRRVVVSLRLQPLDDVFSVNPVAEVEF